MPLLDPRPALPFQMPAPQSLKRPLDEAFDWLDSRSSSASPAPAAMPVMGQQSQSQSPLRPASPHPQQAYAPSPLSPEQGERIIKRRRLAPRPLSALSHSAQAEASASASGSGSASPPEAHDKLTPPPRGRIHEYSQINNLLHTLHTLRTHAASPGSASPSSVVSPPTSPFLPSQESDSRVEGSAAQGRTEDVSGRYEATNRCVLPFSPTSMYADPPDRILGSLALERQKRMGLPEGDGSDDDEGGADEQEGWSGDEGVGWDGDMDM
ncbi:hypothetical protein CALVIDRAFT_358792 [Calocera viscosa TUFC12733]|uniref:Uncharacterized protein n=1 Tax=Calocera viscosa (strain TUFC12733) TaxID=1330018 RepID=A0A167QHD3_CALVF|nr:hypothetical protein CALVIDRAFT_358792 [Calocera viscosa TUFC12733]